MAIKWLVKILTQNFSSKFEKYIQSWMHTHTHIIKFILKQIKNLITKKQTVEEINPY